jgi:hypothetical protein
MRHYVEPALRGFRTLGGSRAGFERHGSAGPAGLQGDPSGGADCAIERLSLRDGSAVVIRPLEPDDTPLIQAIFDQMSEEARYRRFLGYKKRLSARDLQTLTDIDHHGREALKRAVGLLV